MDERVYKSLGDILNSINNIELFCSSRPKELLKTEVYNLVRSKD